MLSAEWRFAKGDHPGAAEPAFDDAAWTRVTLPHTFNAGESGEGDYYRGPGWYRRAFEVAAIEPGRRLYVQFETVPAGLDSYLKTMGLDRGDLKRDDFTISARDQKITGWKFTGEGPWYGVVDKRKNPAPTHDIVVNLADPQKPFVFVVARTVP